MQSNLENVELVMWSQTGEAPLVEFTKNRLEFFGYKPEHAAPVPDTTAFRRAAAGFAAKDVKVTIWTKDADIFGQLEKLEPDENTKRMQRRWLASWEMRFDAEK